jgi:hypothetical protein
VTRFRVPWLVVGAVAFGLAAAPAIAYVCHPDRAGTRTMSLRGAVSIDGMRGTHVSVTVRRGGRCHALSWDVSMGRSQAAACAAVASTGHGLRASIEGAYVVTRNPGAAVRRIWIGYSPLPLRAVAAGSRVYVLTAPAANGPARLLGFDARTGLKTTDYPVPYSGRSLDVAAGVAVFSTTGGSGLFGLRLTDGAIAFLGVERSHDNPQIERAGLVYSDNLYPRRAQVGLTTLKFVPIAAVRRDLSRVGRTLRTPGTIRTFAMDGPRVSLGIAGPGSSCDRVMHWNIPWRYTSFITQPSQREATCRNGRTRVAQVSSLALGGLGSAWVLRGPGASQLVRENSVACVERVLATGSIPLVAGDGSLIAYVKRTGSRWTIGSAGWRASHPIASSSTAVRGLSVDGNRIAVLRANGTVEIRSRWGSLLASVATPGARSLALSGGQLTVLTRSHALQVFDASSGRLVHTWRLPAGVRGLDVHYGVAVLSQGRTVLGIRLATGRTATLARAPRTVRAQIEGPGVAYQYNAAGHGFVGFVPLAKIEQRLG